MLSSVWEGAGVALALCYVLLLHAASENIKDRDTTIDKILFIGVTSFFV